MTGQRGPTTAAAHPGAPADAGVALPMVIGTMAVVSLMLLTALGMALRGAPAARTDQGAKAAVAAAQAGIDEYVSRLNAVDNYWTLGNADPANPAFTTGTTVPGAGAGAARFAYRLTTTPAQTAKSGYILLESTGTASAGSSRPGVSRTLTARLEPDGFLDFIYFTDIESTDPALFAERARAQRTGGASRSSGNVWYFAHPAWVVDRCSRHHYEGRQETSYTSGPDLPYYEYHRPSGTITTLTDAATITLDDGCEEIRWATGDVVDGPLHSNDALQVQGAVRFADPRVESSWATGDPARLWWGGGTPVGPTATPAGHLPRYAPPLSLPAGNQSLLKHVLPKVDADPNTDRPGCLYRGATRIRFQDGQMEVWSPNTDATDTPSRCLDVANRANPQLKPIPPVIHVAPDAGTCTRVGYPRTNESLTQGITTDYAPCRGTAFVQGRVDGQVTVSAEDDIVVTGNLTLRDAGNETDVAGLVAGNNVWVYHPVDSSGDNLLSSGATVRSIEASILSLRHSFIVQNWNEGDDLSATGPASHLRVYGAIAQKFRGPVGTGGEGSGSGYTKNYVYDQRLGVLQPPYFLTPDNAPWAPTQITDG